ncbi:glycosyltransferase family 2 protein [Muricoccus aerilatus]|uniref:glycosyltransferase family 2 protein n=1 Tax=Muricoccus aerilatus TaxID=452982 RepID=UPI0014705306|nr:glycosyltransferase family 2 protein [Roseomonas aerilata]
MTFSNSPIIDVLIPVYNSAATLAESIESIQKQTVSNIRILVVDDGSTDNSQAIIESIAAQDPRVEYIRKPFNSGIVDALNLGMERCQAPYVARHDADDLAYANRFQVQLDYLSSHPECLAVGAVARHIDADGRPLGGYSTLPPPELADPKWIPSREPYLMHPFLMMRGDALKAVGGYRYAFHSEDTDLYWRLQELGRLYNIPELLGEYRIHAGSITSKSMRNARVGAINSQLAAISAVRRRTGQTDLDFPRERVAECEVAGTIEGMLQIVAKDLAKSEYEYLRIAVAAKLAESAGYRLHHLDLEDCDFIRTTLSGKLHAMSLENAGEIKERLIVVGTKMFYRRRFKELRKLLPPKIFAATIQRVVKFSLQARYRRLITKMRLQAARS